MAKIKGLFLDRDDTIIKNVPYMSRVEDIVYLPGALEGIKKIQDKGYSVFIVTNQSGLSRGLITYSELEAIHKKMTDDFLSVGIRPFKFYISPYVHDHPRRKPGSELLFEAERDFGVDLKNSIMIGDGKRDIDAGLGAGLTKVFQVLNTKTFWIEETSEILKSIAL
jgi:D-glycero-D-manno-heptose 1,7-bisphosphate phosphatase